MKIKSLPGYWKKLKSWEIGTLQHEAKLSMAQAASKSRSQKGTDALLSAIKESSKYSEQHIRCEHA